MSAYWPEVHMLHVDGLISVDDEEVHLLHQLHAVMLRQLLHGKQQNQLRKSLNIQQHVRANQDLHHP